ncbi:VOC family protein [Actinoplanes sp. G11-F43]|uniref:VOC family protein n=1 Tax=Actinoplanes sp. G11-F43 TaxID=3424130 RepID=UPI003D3546F8
MSTPDVPRLQAFYERVFDAVPVNRFPAEGPAFFVGLRIGDSEVGLVSEAGVDLSVPSRILLSVEVGDVDAFLERVGPAGGRVLGHPNDMPWGQRVAHVHDPDGNMVNLTGQPKAG